MKKHANLIIGILLGIGAYHLYTIKKKKGCGCGGHAEGEEIASVSISSSGGDDSECDKAVRSILAERKSLMRVTPEDYQKQYEEEMTICRGYMNS